MDEIAIAPSTEIAPATEAPTVETETPTIETPGDGETPATETDTGGEGGDETELPGDPGEGDLVDTDARTLDKQTSENISALKKMAKASTDPAQQKVLADAAKNLADKHFRFKAYEKEFPTVQDARQAKATLESLGGEEGITSMQEEVSDYRKEIEQFSNGDRGLIESLYKSNPESTVKMVEAALDVFREGGNINALDQVLLAPMVQRLQQVGLHSNLLKVAEFIKAGDGQKAYDTLAAVGEWLAKLTGDAEKIGTERSKAPDPREKEFQEREQRLQQQEREENTRRLSDEITVLNNRHMAKVLDPFFKELKLTHEGKREFAQNVLRKCWAAMKEDKTYLRNAQNIRSKGDNKRTAEFISAKFAEVLPAEFRKYKNTLYPNLGRVASTNGKPTPAAGGKPPAKPAPTNGAAVRVAEAPAFDTVDWKKTPDSLWMKGYAYLLNGKYVYYH
jgi:hypothetical protein